MEDRFLSRFTPSLMPPEALEAIFVQREELLQNILERVRASAHGPAKNSTLLVGPRGIGKTHLISLVYHRLRSIEEIRDRIRIAWMREEEWGIENFRDLLLRILRALKPDDESPLASLYALSPEEAETAARNLIVELVGSGTLVLLIENLDDLVRKLGGPGEMKFFNFLRQCHAFCMVATSPGPAARVFAPGSPFRKDFFEIHVLKELDFETAVRLVSKIADYQGDAELASMVLTPRGRARIRALRYLAGGNHRAYVIFAPLIARESIGQLIGPLMQTIDDLTPYYNSRIAALPGEQRQILEYTCEARRRVKMSDIASACFLPPAAAASHLNALCALGHLQALRVGGESYYELREPLLRLSFEVKKHRGKPIGLLQDFLRLWYSPAELKQKLSVIPAAGAPEQCYVPDLQAFQRNWEDPRVMEACREFGEAFPQGDFERARKAAEELVAVRGLIGDWMAQASCLLRLGRHDAAIAIYDQALRRHGEDAAVWRSRASALRAMGRYEEALASCRKSLSLDKSAVETWNCEASILLHLGRPEEALYDCEAALKLNENDPLAWTNLGVALADLDLFDESCRAFVKLVELEPQNAGAHTHLCAALIELGHWNEALKEAQKAIRIDPGQRESWVLLGSVLARMGKSEEALEAFEKAVAMGERSAYTQFKMVELLLSIHCWRQAAERLDEALGECAQSEDSGDTKVLIRRLQASLPDPPVLHLLIKVFLLTYRKHRMLGALAHGLITCIPDVTAPDKLSDADACLWRDSWERAASNMPELRLPVRLLNSAVRYRTTRDTRILLSLSLEERTLLETLLGIRSEAIA